MICHCFNPYFTGLPILIILKKCTRTYPQDSFNPYFTGLPILILTSETTFSVVVKDSFNPYFTGLPILIDKNSCDQR